MRVIKKYFARLQGLGVEISHFFEKGVNYNILLGTKTEGSNQAFFSKRGLIKVFCWAPRLGVQIKHFFGKKVN
jgi:hypothetical protein